MSLTKKEREQNQETVLRYVWECNNETSKKRFSLKEIADRLKVSSASISRYIEELINKKLIAKVGKNKYQVSDLEYSLVFNKPFASEDRVWKLFILPKLENKISDCGIKNLNYIFTEIFNNAIEHSEGDMIQVSLYINPFRVLVSIIDNGIGIFEKIKQNSNLDEKRYAILELAKGKYTTNPQSHTGEGIFFSSKIADTFFICSDGLTYAGEGFGLSILMDSDSFMKKGTMVFFTVNTSTKKSINSVFAKFSATPDSYGFEKTTIAVKLLEFGESVPTFNSRSQAKRLLARLDRFKSIVLNFEDVDSIGQGFADEIFRVFRNNHRDCEIKCINVNKKVQFMIDHVTSEELQ